MKGTQQLVHICGIYYLDKFAHLAKLNATRVRLFPTANLDWPSQQLRVKASLNDNLDKEMYKEDFPSFESHFN